MSKDVGNKGKGAPGHKVNWTEEEDNELRRLIRIHGSNKWSDIAKGLNGKQPKQCRRRWQNVLSVTLKQGEWTLEVWWQETCKSFTHSKPHVWCRIANDNRGQVLQILSEFRG